MYYNLICTVGYKKPKILYRLYYKNAKAENKQTKNK